MARQRGFDTQGSMTAVCRVLQCEGEKLAHVPVCTASKIDGSQMSPAEVDASHVRPARPRDHHHTSSHC
jgi:hypothetical protein